MTKKRLQEFILLSFIFFTVGLIYSGSLFLNNFYSAVPTLPYGDSFSYMTPGDHFEQFYRFNLFKYNIINQEAFTFSGYQYNNSSNSSFTESLIFYPFVILNYVFSLVFGDVGAYNFMALLYYVITGLTMYYLAKYISGNSLIAFISSLFYVLVPFHTSFLYGEMVYALDASLLPLIILFYEKYFETKEKKYILFFSIVLFFLFTSNIQVGYFFVVFSFPYFLFRYFNYFKFDDKVFIKDKIFILIYFMISLIPSLFFIRYFSKNIMSKSDLSDGQVWNELFTYSPTFTNLLNVFNGNEKNVYLGFVLFIPIFILFYYGYKNFINYFDEIKKRNIVIFFLLFLFTYLLSFGPNLDNSLGIDFYKIFFDYLPMFNGTRTPGRLMSIVVFYYAILLSYLLLYFINTYNSRIKILILILIPIIVFFDYKYVKPSMVKIENNKIYTILPSKAKVVAIPFQIEPDHYENATYMYFSLMNNLRLFNGHSSFFPKSMRSDGEILKELNIGRLSYNTWKWLKENNFEYLTVHNTSFLPNVNKHVLISFILNKNLELIDNDNGIYLFKLKNENFNENEFPFSEIYEKAKELNVLESLENKINYLLGWYDLEVYPNQASFRWMNNTISRISYVPSMKNKYKLSFYYRNPLDELSVFSNDEKIDFNFQVKDGGWKYVEIILPLKEYYEIKFETSGIYRELTDSRSFGCMISEIKFEELK